MNRAAWRWALVIVAAVVVALLISTSAHTNSNEADDGLQKLSEDQRAATFTRFLEGESCGTVKRTFYQGSLESTGAAFWNAECTSTAGVYGQLGVQMGRAALGEENEMTMQSVAAATMNGATRRWAVTNGAVVVWIMLVVALVSGCSVVMTPYAAAASHVSSSSNAGL